MTPGSPSEIAFECIRDKTITIHPLSVVLVECLSDAFCPFCHAFELQEIIERDLNDLSLIRLYGGMGHKWGHFEGKNANCPV